MKKLRRVPSDTVFITLMAVIFGMVVSLANVFQGWGKAAPVQKLFYTIPTANWPDGLKHNWLLDYVANSLFLFMAVWIIMNTHGSTGRRPVRLRNRVLGTVLFFGCGGGLLGVMNSGWIDGLQGFVWFGLTAGFLYGLLFACVDRLNRKVVKSNGA